MFRRASLIAILVAGLSLTRCYVTAQGFPCDAKNPCPTHFYCDSTDHCAAGSAAVDSGPMDSGEPDSGENADSGSPEDAGAPDSGIDAGRVDSGPIDSGFDAGPTDSGFDAGGSDAGTSDAGFDAGPPDSGSDAGTLDSGFDAGSSDSGGDAGMDAGPPDAGMVAVDAGPCGYLGNACCPDNACASEVDLACVSNVCVNAEWSHWVEAANPDAVQDTNYVDNGDGTVTDNTTGLLWEQTNVATTCMSLPCGWQKAVTTCQNLPFVGQFDAGWRLPTAIELASLVDYSGTFQGITIDQNIFPFTADAGYWTATTEAGDALYVDFSDGEILADDVGIGHLGRCVR